MQLVPTRLEGPVLLAPKVHGEELRSERVQSAPRPAEIADSLAL
jgi:hypothetical protein